jgi:hypothetical protein
MRRTVTLRCGAAALLLALGAHGQPRPAATVLRAQRASAARARSTLATHLPAITRCLDAARATDPGPLAAVRFIDATLPLDRAGAAVSVEFVPPLLSRGLSACLAETLLDWSMGAPAGPDGVVVLRITNPASR